MTTEVQKPSEIHSMLYAFAVIGGLYLLSNFAFSLKVAKEHGKKTRWHCEEEGCDKSFQTGWNVQITHENHDKSNPLYDDESIAKTRCIEHHLKQHEDAVGNEESIGLSVQANNYAIKMLRKTEHRTRWWKQKNGV